MTEKKKLPVDLSKLGKSVSKQIERDRKKMKKSPSKHESNEGIDESCKWDERGDR